MLWQPSAGRPFLRSFNGILQIVSAYRMYPVDTEIHLSSFTLVPWFTGHSSQLQCENGYDFDLQQLGRTSELILNFIFKTKFFDSKTIAANEVLSFDFRLCSVH